MKWELVFDSEEELEWKQGESHLIEGESRNEYLFESHYWMAWGDGYEMQWWDNREKDRLTATSCSPTL